MGHYPRKLHRLPLVVTIFCMLKASLTIFFLLISIQVSSSESPNETKIYFHIHQATRWAELHHSGNFLFSKKEMGKHLGKLKYSEINLVKSKFYQEYLFLNNLSHTLQKSSYLEIEKFRERIHSKAEKLKIPHSKDWHNEFF